MKARLAQIFAGAPREMWTAKLQVLDCCYSEVLTMEEAVTHQHNRARDSYVEDDGLVQPRSAPRFMDTAAVAPKMWQPDSGRDDILREIGLEDVSWR